jgi:hypothetical protein
MYRALLGIITGLVVMVGGLLFTGGQATAAAGCDDYAIMYCGASTPSQFINKVNNDGRHSDHKAIYDNFGLVPAEYGKFARTAKQGTLHENGNITVDGVVVGRSTMNVGRVHDSNFNQRVSVNGHDYWGGSFGSTYHANTADVMVMFNDKGVMQFAVISSCGNPQRITPNKPIYSCDRLQKTKVDGTKNTYRFTTRASASQGAQVVKVVYDFGDGETKTATDLSQPVQHTFKKDSKVRVTVYVRVPGGNVVTTTGADCITEIKFQPPETPTPTAYCSTLQATLLDQATRNYKFVVTAQFSSGVAFTSADFNFGDGVIMRGLVPNGKTATVRHAYGKVGTYTAVATLHFTTSNGQKGTSNCEATITPTTVECKPGIPQGSPECEERRKQDCVSEGKGSECELTNTGPGAVIAALFGGVSTVAGAGHYFFRRRLLG